MIIISGTIDLEPGRREAALEAAGPLMARTRAQPGCRHYVWSADPLQPDRVYVYEEWEDEKSLASHFQGPHYLAMRDTMAAHGLRGIAVSKHAPARSEPVYDSTGTPRADFFTAK